MFKGILMTVLGGVNLMVGNLVVGCVCLNAAGLCFAFAPTGNEKK